MKIAEIGETIYKEYEIRTSKSVRLDAEETLVIPIEAAALSCPIPFLLKINLRTVRKIDKRLWIKKHLKEWKMILLVN